MKLKFQLLGSSSKFIFKLKIHLKNFHNLEKNCSKFNYNIEHFLVLHNTSRLTPSKCWQPR